VKELFSDRAGPLAAAAVCVLLAAIVAAPVSANVYATDLKFSAPAVDATQPNPSVQLSFRLNEAADQEVRIDIHRADNDALVRSVSLGPLPRGLNTWTWDLKNDSNVLVATNVEYYFKVYTRGSGYGSWTQISDDSIPELHFEWPKDVAVNTNPDSPYFGWTYVYVGRNGTTVSGRSTPKGIYTLLPDATQIGGPTLGGLTWPTTFASTTGPTSPFSLTIGPEDKLYLTDWSDVNGGVWVAPPDLSGTWKAILSPSRVGNAPNAYAPYTQHGSISDVLVVGKGLNRRLFTIDEDLRVEGDTTGVTQGSIWTYDIGPLDIEHTGPPNLYWRDGSPNRVINFVDYLQRDADGSIFVSQWRANGTDQPSLFKVSPDGSSVVWASLAAWGSPDPLRGIRAPFALDVQRRRIAAPSVELGVVNVFNLDANGIPQLASLTAVGGGALVWLAGANSSLYYSSNIGASFSAQTAPETGVALNAISVSNASTTGLNGWAVGNGGKIFRLDNRNTWTAETSGTSEDLNGVVAIWNNTSPAVVHGWAVGDNGTILSNMNGAWVTESSPVTVKLNAISRRIRSFAGPVYDLYAVGDGGTIIRRLDAPVLDNPTQWEIQVSGTTANLNAISMLVFATAAGTTTGYVVGDNGTILKTTNGGAEWVAQTSGTTVRLNGVYAVTATAAWAVGDNGTILRTTDGGATWVAQNSGTTANLNAVFFRDTQTGWVVGNGGVTLRTINGGNTWTVIANTGSQNLRAVAAVAVGAGAPRGVTFDAAGNLHEVNNVTERLRVYSPPDGVNEFTTKSVARFVPTAGSPAKPATPVVTAPASTASTSQLSASWTATGAAYRYAIGVTAEDQGEYIVGWTNTTSTSVTRTGLSLENGVTYFWYVQARSANNVWSDVGISAGTIVQAPSKIGLAKTRPDNAPVTLENVVVTKLTQDESLNTNGFFVQEQDQSAGVRVKWTGTAPPLNTLVTVVGTMGTDGPERVVNATSVVTGAPFTPTPVGVTNKAVGGSKPTGGAGLPNDGLLATVWGKVTAIDFATTTFYLDDGSGVDNDTPTAFVPNKVPGIKVKSPLATPFTTGSYYKVTGIVRLEQVGSKVIRRLDALSDDDIVLVNP